jgi:hypothetical protein
VPTPTRPPNDSTLPTTLSGRALSIMVELVELGRAIELHPEPWAWPLAQRSFAAKRALQELVGEVLR